MEAAKAAAKGTSPSVKKDKIQSGLAQAAIQAAQEGYPVFSGSSDVQGSTGICLLYTSTSPRDVEEWGIAG